jgi:hypothetical protein
LTTNCILCRKSTDLSWEGDEPSAAVAEEASAPAVEESALLAQAETVSAIKPYEGFGDVDHTIKELMSL